MRPNARRAGTVGATLTVAALALLAAGCKPAPTPPPPEERWAPAPTEPAAPATAADLAALLGERGISLAAEGEQTLEYFDTPGWVYRLGEDSLEVHEHASAEAAAATAARIAPDARIIEQPDGTRVAVEWLGSPHVFVNGPLLVVYVGADQSVLGALSGILGSQIAGD